MESYIENIITLRSDEDIANINNEIKNNNNKIKLFDTKKKNLYKKIEEIQMEITECEKDIDIITQINLDLNKIGKIIMNTRDLNLYITNKNYTKILEILKENKNIILEFRNNQKSNKMTQICNSYVYQENKVIDLVSIEYINISNNYLVDNNIDHNIQYNNIIDLIKFFGENIIFDNITNNHIIDCKNIFKNTTSWIILWIN